MRQWDLHEADKNYGVHSCPFLVRMNCETYMRQLKLLCSEVDSQNLHDYYVQHSRSAFFFIILFSRLKLTWLTNEKPFSFCFWALIDNLVWSFGCWKLDVNGCWLALILCLVNRWHCYVLLIIASTLRLPALKISEPWCVLCNAVLVVQH